MCSVAGGAIFDEESTWEPVEVMKMDVPAMFKSFFDQYSEY